MRKRKPFRPNVETLEDRLTPASLTIVGAESGPSLVKVFDGSLRPVHSFIAYDPAFTGGVRVGIGDVNGDRVPDYICAPGPGAVPLVKIVDGTKANQVLPNGQISDAALVASFIAYEPVFTDGLFVAAGDLDGDRIAEVAVSSPLPTGSQVKLFDIVGGRAILTGPGENNFRPYGAGFTAPITLATGDLDGDGDRELITGTFRNGTVVKAFDGRSGAELLSFTSHPSFDGGVNVAAADVDNDGRDDIITGPGVGGRGRVKVFSGKNSRLLLNKKVMGNHYKGGTRVAVADLNGRGLSVLGGPTPDVRPDISLTSPLSGKVVGSFDPFGPNYTGGVFIASVSVAAD
jgi:hypothetical protein